ncbi:MAG: ATP-binding protein [Bacillales bacterium]|nr:ATP-binding protein [Bacillales bacterium]
MMTYINRAIEDILKNRFDTSKSVAITGARQVGKTTMTTHMFPKIRRINLKNVVLLNNAKEDPQGFLENFERPLFIDEVQMVPELIGVAKTILDEVSTRSNYLFSGSQKWELMKGLSESLAGMVSILELGTLSLREINNVSFNTPFIPTLDYFKEREKCIKKYNNLWKVIHRGGYPELYEDDPRDWEEYYSSYVKTYIERDVYDITKIRDNNLFYRFMVSVAARTGNMLDYSSISKDIGVSLETIRNWISVLEKTDIIYLLEPYYNSHLSRAIKTPKVYFRDTGLAAYLTSWLTPETLENGAMNGAFFETFVINEIIKSYINQGKDYKKRIYYYRGKDKVKKTQNGIDTFEENEIDLIIEENGVLYPIEIKKTTNPKSEMASAFDVLDKDLSKKRGIGAIICRGDYKLKLRDNLYALPIEYI